jgi:two-component system, chemotaxis family, protein-glutamate methylesterase/glutaminase
VIRVLVVDDSAFMRNAIRSMLGSDRTIEVVGVGRNGKEAIELNDRLKPDVITMDIEMPEMDGLTALERIMRTRPTRVLMLSSLTTKGSRAAMRALSLGAADVLAKDGSQISLTIESIKADLLERVRAIAASKPLSNAAAAPPAALAPPPAFLARSVDVLAIGSSTGGPAALDVILGAIPAGFPAAVVVAQHMPAMFTESMSHRLNELCHVPVVHVVDRVVLSPGHIYIARGGMHMHVRKAGPLRFEAVMSPDPVSAVYRPSVDALLASTAIACGNRCLGIVLTGIGQDGLIGAKELRSRGGRLWAQDEASSVVYGMPKAVTENGLVEANMNPQTIAKVLSLSCPAFAPRNVA